MQSWSEIDDLEVYWRRKESFYKIYTYLVKHVMEILVKKPAWSYSGFNDLWGLTATASYPWTATLSW